MSIAVFVVGVVVATVLLGLLLLTLLFPAIRLWPTAGEGSWQSYVWWPLFRGLNVLCFAMAILDRQQQFGLPWWLRGLAFAMMAASVALFVYAFRVLGRNNSYGAREGLVTAGIYQWSRNPQNALLIVVYAFLAVATDNGPTVVLCLAMMSVYYLMVLAEEPWLHAAYGDAYRRYCADVPRLVNWRRAAAQIAQAGRT